MLIHKMFRDIIKNKVPFLAIFLMLFAGNFIFSGITSEYNGMNQYFHSFIKETNLADAWVLGNQFTDKAVKQLKAKDNITNVEKRLLIPSTLNTKQKQSIDLYILDNESEISSIKVTNGKPYDKLVKGVWMDITFAEENNLKLHDEISLNINGTIVKKKMVGFCYSPEYIYNTKNGEMLPNHEKNGFIMMNKRDFPNPDYIQWNQLVISGKNNLKNTIVQALAPNNITVVLKNEHPSYSMLNDEIKQHKEIGMIFVAVFLFIAVLVTITTVHRLLHSERLQIGILKSLGFRKQILYNHYISHSIFICLTASLLGWCIGYITLPNLILPMMNTMYILPILKAKMLPLSWLLPIICTIFCFIISLIVCRKYLAGNAASILYSNTLEKTYKELPLSFLWKHLSFYSQWNSRDIFRNKLRSIMTILGVIGCVALLFSSCGLYTSMNHISSWTFHKLQTFDTKITGNFADLQYKKDLITSMNGEELMEVSIELSWKNKKQIASFTGIESQNFLHLMENEKKEIKLSKGMALSKNIADNLGIQTGDLIKWRLEGTDKWYESKVFSIIRTPLSQGITMTKQEMKKESIPFTVTSIIGNKPKQISLKSDYITSIQNKEDLIASFDTMMEASTILFGIFLIAAILLGSVILYNLGTLSYMERYKDMATLKVLGFSNKRVQKLMIQQNLWLTLIGILLGLPTGYALLLTMLDTIQASLDLTLFIPYAVYAVSILGTLLLSWFINKCLSYKIYHINMVAALKANE